MSLRSKSKRVFYGWGFLVFRHLWVYLMTPQVQPFNDSRRFLLSALNESLFLLWTPIHCPRLNPSSVLKRCGTLAELFVLTYCSSCSNALAHWSLKRSQLQPLHDSRRFLRSALNESLFALWMLTQFPRANPSVVLKGWGTLAELFVLTYCSSCSNPSLHWSSKRYQLQSLHDDSRRFLL